MIAHSFFFTLLIVLTAPIRLLPFPAIRWLGNCLGLAVYFLVPKYRKRALSNLSLATELALSEKELIAVAKQSMQNLMITCLEYAKFASLKNTGSALCCENPEEAAQLMKEGKPVIFFCGHLANWEALFLEGTQRMPGVAIGRPIKNQLLYNWILSIRQKYGGKMITPQNAIREGLRGLKKGCFLGVVGDQGMPDSGFSSPFLGRRAWTSPIAALLSHRTGSPIIVATTRRVPEGYKIHYSHPIWPRSEEPAQQEIDRLMRESLAVLEESIKKHPGEWLWSHNRWKQQTPEKLKKGFRHEAILIVLPSEENLLQYVLNGQSVFREVYPREFLTVYAPPHAIDRVNIADAEVLPYEVIANSEKKDYRFKLVLNFSSCRRIERHFKKLSAIDTHNLTPDPSFPEQFKKWVLKSHAS